MAAKSELAQRVASAIVMIAAAIGTAWLGHWPFALFWFLAALAVAYEWLRLIESRRLPLEMAMVGAALAACIWALMVNTPAVLLGAVAAATAAVGVTAGRGPWGALMVPYVTMLLAGTILVRGAPGTAAPHGLAGIVFVFAAVWATDVGAYFAGRRFGGPKFAPRISPKKTWSGVVGGLCAGILAALLVAAAMGYELRASQALIALTLGVAVVGGDLFESFLKRRFGAKDAGSLIPGHGGFLDRLDGYTLAVGLAALIGGLRSDWADVAGGLLR